MKWTYEPGEIKHIFDSAEFVNIEQYPGWNNIEKTGIKTNYCISDKGYAAVQEYRIEARVVFGPVAKSSDDKIELISEIIRYYKSRNFLSLQVLLGMEVGSESTQLQYNLFKKHKYKTYTDKFNKGTLILDLKKDLLKGFSENHRRSIKKAIKHNFVCRVLGRDDILDFSRGYYEMYKKRGLSTDLNQCINSFSSMFEWICLKGFFLGVFDNRKMVGGVLIIFRGKIAEYYRGFSLPDERKLPINHIAFFEAMNICEDNGIDYFDFGGYNLLVKNNDQVFQINKFKKGFGGRYFGYPPVMYFDLKPYGTSIVKLVKRVRLLFRPK